VSNNNEFLRGKPTDASGTRVLSLVGKALLVLIIAGGLQAAAQKFAYSVGYAPRLVGTPPLVFTVFGIVIPVYPFWHLLLWTLGNFRDNIIMGLLYEAWKLAAYTCFAAIISYFFFEFLIVGFKKQNIFGTARWAVKKDLEKAGILQLKGGVILGQLTDAKVDFAYDNIKDSVVLHLKMPSRKIIQSGIYNTLLSAPTRSGKGVSSVIPTLVSYPGSTITLDYKGENFNVTSGHRAKFGKVYRWEPTGNKGHAFNPMMEIRTGENAFADANLIADILTTPASGGGNATSDHFQTGAKDFLTSLILHCLTCPDWKIRTSRVAGSSFH